jgi:BMFP domain-containing protein YqiC
MMDEVSSRNFNVLAEGLNTVRKENADLARKVRQLEGQLAQMNQAIQLITQQANAMRVLGSTSDKR